MKTEKYTSAQFAEFALMTRLRRRANAGGIWDVIHRDRVVRGYSVSRSVGGRGYEVNGPATDHMFRHSTMLVRTLDSAIEAIASDWLILHYDAKHHTNLRYRAKAQTALEDLKAASETL